VSSGGKDFHYIPCLNDEAAWIAALGNLAQQNLAGWPTTEAPDAQALARSREAALAKGAPR
jgi:ferrochelatase